MTEKELSELYMRLALQFDSVLGTLVSKNLVCPDFVPGIRKDFYHSSEWFFVFGEWPRNSIPRAGRYRTGHQTNCSGRIGRRNAGDSEAKCNGRQKWVIPLSGLTVRYNPRGQNDQ